MPQEDWLILVIIGGAFLILGIIGIIWGISEEKRIFEALSQKPDLRRFSLHSIQPGAIKIGGWIAFVLGLIIAIAGIILWRTGWPLE